MRSKVRGRSHSPHRGVLARLGKNFGWLAGSTGISAVASLVYIGLTARTLGPREFGGFSLVMTFGELFANLAQFQSWKAVIGYGANHKEDGNERGLARLFGYAVALDWASGLLGALVAILFVPLIGPLLHWDPAEQEAAKWFAAALLLTSSTAPAGMLRLFDRFDLQAYSETVAQFTRLAGCLIGWRLGLGVPWFLATWATAALLQLISQWICVAALGHRPSFWGRSMRLATTENRDIWPFMLKTSVSSSLSFVWMQCGILVVGARAGPIEAGGFRLAHRFSLALMKPVEIATKALLPELARFGAIGDDLGVRRLLLRVTLVAGTFAAIMLAASGLWGREILGLTAGTPFEFAHGFLFILSIAAAISVAGFAFEPFLNAKLRAGLVLRAYIVAAIVYGAFLALLLAPLGARAAAFASIAAALVLILQLGVSAMRILRLEGASDELLAKVELA